MTPDSSPWFQRWLQDKDEDILYVDQSSRPAARPLTLEALDRAVEAAQRLAAAQAQEQQAEEEDHDEP